MKDNELFKNKIDFQMVFEVINGNPNGDPDMDNRPRMDDETGLGLITDVCLKRKVRNYISLVHGNEQGYGLYINTDNLLNDKERMTAEEYLEFAKGAKITDKDLPKAFKTNKDLYGLIEYLNSKYFDIRFFGAVLTQFKKWKLNGCGALQGPLQFCIAQSVDPVTPMEMTITRQALCGEADKDKDNTMGNKYIIPYGLYTCNGHLTPAKAGCSFTVQDKEYLFEAVKRMFELDHAASRGEMNMRKVVVFTHDSPYGNANACDIFDRIHIQKKDCVIYPRKFADYDFDVDMENFPKNISCEIL